MISSRQRYSRFLLQWESADGLDQNGALVVRSGQTPTFARGGTAGAASAVDANGRIYVPGVNSPRFHHRWNGSIWAPVGVLSDGQRTNLVLSSRDLSAASWAKTGCTGTKNAVGSDGIAGSASTFAETATTGFHSASGTATMTITPNVVHSFAATFKANGRTKGSLFIFAGADNTGVQFDLTAGTLVDFIGGASPVTSRKTLEVLGGGYYRISVSGLLNAASTTCTLVLESRDNAGNRSYAGDGTSGFLVDTIQFENNFAYSSSPIPTLGAAVTRSEDTFSIPFNAAPQALSMYVDYTDLGTYGDEVNQYRIVNFGGLSAARLSLNDFTTYGGLSVAYEDILGGRTMAADPARPIGTRVEAMATLTAAGSVGLTYALNGGAPVIVGSASAIQLDPWAAQVLYVNEQGNGAMKGSRAIRSIRIAAAVQSLAYMQAA